MSRIKMYLVACVLVLSIIQFGAATYNSTTSCRAGNNQTTYYSATCDVDTNNERRVIAVKRVMYGAKPDDHVCGDTDPASQCCSYEEGQDCFFPNDPGQIPSSLVDTCSGKEYCLTKGNKKRTSSCPLPSLFSKSFFTTYGHFEFECLNIGLLTDICHDAIIKTGSELYIASNIYYVNKEHSDKTCSCIVTTKCEAAIQIDAVDISLGRLPGSCIEKLHFTDLKENITSRTVDCWETGLNGFTPILTSSSNEASVDMVINGNHTGRLWIKVSSTWSNATVQLRCGVAGGLPIDEDHKCTEDKETTTTISTTSTSTTTSTVTTTPTTTEPTTAGDDECDEGTKVCTPKEEDTTQNLPQGAIIGIIIAGVIILLVIIIILVLVFRRHQRPAEHDYDVPTSRNPDYETLHYHNVAPKPLHDMNAYDNPSYDQAELEKNGAIARPVSDYEHLNHEQLDNQNNDSVMVMPKGAVM